MIIASDHRGYKLKETLKKEFTFTDITPNYVEGDDYPDIVKLFVKALKTKGILICGSGTGVAIAANRNKTIRAVNAYDKKHAEMARRHENVNVLCLGADYLTKNQSKEIIKTFMETKFDGGRHLRRIKKL